MAVIRPSVGGRSHEFGQVAVSDGEIRIPQQIQVVRKEEYALVAGPHPKLTVMHVAHRPVVVTGAGKDGGGEDAQPLINVDELRDRIEQGRAGLPQSPDKGNQTTVIVAGPLVFDQ